MRAVWLCLVVTTYAVAQTPDLSSGPATQAISMKKAAGVTITTASLSDGQVGTAYSETLTAQGQNQPFTWSIQSGALPAGLRLSSSGDITGTPSAPGTATFTVKVIDGDSASATKALSINIVAPLVITTTSLPAGQVGAIYSQLLGSSGGTSPNSWSIAAGALPAGLTLSSAGQISGTPSAAGTANFTVKVTGGNSASATKALSINILGAVAITTTSLPAGQVGTAYSQNIGVSGGAPPYTWSIAAGALPGGLTLSSGQVSGTPSAAGTANFTVKVTDSSSGSATKAFSISIAAAVAITTRSLASGQVGTAYSQSIGVSGGAPPYTWSIATGALPAGLALSSAGQISGTPSTAGTANFTIRVTDSASGTDSLATSLMIQPAQLSVAITSLASGSTGVTYSQNLQASGGSPPYSWSLTNGALPSGLTLSSSGQIRGTPAAAGTFAFSATVTDSLASTAVANLGITVTAGVSISGCPTATGTVGQVYNASLAAAGGTSPYSWSITTGQLPTGLALDGQRGQISGTPTAAGTSAFTVRVSDSGSGSATQNCSIAVSAATSPLSVGTVSLPDGISGVQYGQTLSASGGQPPYSWSVTGGALPPGLSLSANGRIAGIASTAGQFAFTVRVADSASGTATKALSIRIGAALAITACPAGAAVVGQAYTGSASAAGGLPPYAWTVSGALPPGLTLDRTSGSLTGTPTLAGSSTYILVASDSASATVNKTCSMNVTAALTIMTTVLAGGDPSLSYSQQLSASGGIPPYAWSVSSGTLPGGLVLSTSGSISGLPTAAGNFPFTVRVTDSSGLSAVRPLSIAVVSSMSIVCPAANAVYAQPYSSAASVIGGQPPYSWSPASGLPAGLLVSTTGQVTGVPNDTGTFSYTLFVADKNGASASQQCTLTVTANVTILTVSLPDASQNSPYSQILTATGGKTPYSWSIVSGTVASGLNLNPGGLLSGSATQVGLASFTVKVMDASGASTQKSFSINVLSGLLVATCPPNVGEIGLPISVSLAAAGGALPYNWSVSSGSLPSGLTLDPSTGTVSGTPTQSGTVLFTLMATDSTNHSATRQCTMDVRPALAISTSSLASSVTGAAYSDSVAASGGQPPYIWLTTAGSLPPGLSLSGTGQITGKPVVAGTFAFTIQASDNLGAQITKELAITIGQGLAIVDCPTPVGVVGQPYAGALAAAGGTSPYQWSISSGALPSGLLLDGSNAQIAGLPSEAGSSSYILQVTDSGNKSATRACTIQIRGATLTITSASLPDAMLGIQYAQTLAASGGRAPYSWSIVTAGAPDGFSLGADGALTGTASTAGSFTFTIQVTDQDNNVARQTVALNIRAGAAPNVAIVGLPNIVGPAQQPTFSLQLDATYPADISGTMTLSFTPDPAIGVDDPAVRFATGARVLQFTVPANSNRPIFLAPILALQTGTVAGSIQLAVSIQSNGTDITPAAASVYTIRVDRLAPKLVSVNAVRTSASTMELRIIGFATTRQVTQGVFQFQPVNGGQAVSVPVSLVDTGTSWFQNAQSKQFGGQFALTQPFTFQGQSPTDFSAVSITLSNDQGNSDSMSVKF